MVCFSSLSPFPDDKLLAPTPHGEVVAHGSLRVHNGFLWDVDMDVLFDGELFIQVESTGHLEDVLPSVVLCFRSFKQCHEGTVGTQCRSGAEGRGVGKWMVRDHPMVYSLLPDEGQHLVVGILLVPFGTG